MLRLSLQIQNLSDINFSKEPTVLYCQDDNIFDCTFTTEVSAKKKKKTNKKQKNIIPLSPSH